MHLPLSEYLETNKLASVFSSRSSTYKFYWLLAIIESVECGKQEITKKEIFARIITNSWYTINYFRISFGKQDLIQKAVVNILEHEKPDIKINKEQLLSLLINSNNSNTLKNLEHFNNYVPHRFLTPWFPKEKAEVSYTHKKRIYSSSVNFKNDCLYALSKDSVTINPNWFLYLKYNSKVLKDFCFWNLSLYLQLRNPNVPDIGNKLIKPNFRNTLTNQRANYWNIVFKQLGSIKCIYTNKDLFIDSYALDHFVPYAFVSHNLIWNLIPIDKNFNSSKGDKLPSMDFFFDKFFELQKTAFEIIRNEYPNSKLLEDYLTIYPAINKIEDFEYLRYKENIQPLITIANNNGFAYMICL